MSVSIDGIKIGRHSIELFHGIIGGVMLTGKALEEKMEKRYAMH